MKLLRDLISLLYRMTQEEFWFIANNQKVWSQLYLEQKRKYKKQKNINEKERSKQRNNISIVYNEPLDSTR